MWTEYAWQLSRGLEGETVSGALNSHCGILLSEGLNEAQNYACHGIGDEISISTPVILLLFQEGTEESLQ